MAGRGEEEEEDGDDDDDDDAEDFIQESGFNIPREPENTGAFVLEMLHTRSFKRPDIASEMTYAVTMRNPSNNILLSDLLGELEDMFARVLNHLRARHSPSDPVRVYIEHPELGSPIIVPPMHLGYLTPHTIMSQIEFVLHSAEAIPADGRLRINVAIVRGIRGAGFSLIINAVDDGFRKKSTITIRNGSEDNLCLARAIAVANAHSIMKEDPLNANKQKYFKKIKDSRRQEQKKQALRLLQDTGLPPDPMREGNLEDVPYYEQLLRVSVCVIGSCVSGNQFQRVYNGSPIYSRRLFLYHHTEGHFDVITKVNALMSKRFYCDKCGTSFDKEKKHACSDWCSVCDSSICERASAESGGGDSGLVCSDCNRSCRSTECFERHKTRKKKIKRFKQGKLRAEKISLCALHWRCPSCYRVLDTTKRQPELHVCGEFYCYNCRYYDMLENHSCYMRSVDVDEGKPGKRFIFYDFECQQDREHGGIHKPNLVVAHSVCDECKDVDVDAGATCNHCGNRCNKCCIGEEDDPDKKPPCPGSCGHRENVFKGADTNISFCRWLLSAQHQGFTVIAHNAKAYDNYFIFQYCLDRCIAPKIIFNGSKIMYMKISYLQMRFLDSVNFLPMPLSALPKSFGLEELKKGFFPHFFNLPENEGKVFPTLPDMKFYDPDNMTEGKRKEFLQWYERHKSDAFDFDAEILSYCKSDVDILLKACMKYKDLMEEITAELTIGDGRFPYNPFKSLTLASVCLAVFRSKFLEEEWEVLLKHNAKKGCLHDKVSGCSCWWNKGRKRHGNAPLEYFCPFHGEWLPVAKSNAVQRRFVSSPIGLLPPGGYQNRDQHSMQASKWLAYMERSLRRENGGEPVEMRQARHPKGEKRVRCPISDSKAVTYKLDGEVTLKCGKKIALEFNGCHWHGCPRCYTSNRERTIVFGKSIDQRYRESLIKVDKLKGMGYKVIVMWSCEYEEEIEGNADMRQFISSLDFSQPIDVRHCYFGGRTNAIELHRKFQPGEKGHYVDFCSLYPAVLKYNEYPSGHPVRILKNFKSFVFKPCGEKEKCGYSSVHTHHVGLPYFGIMKVTVLPPKSLLFPVLPYRAQGKLKFPLCKTCSEKAPPTEGCSCPDSKRSWTQTYCTPELEVALNIGYRIEKIHEVLHWEKTDRDGGEGGLFTRYINTFLRIKQEASGLPPGRDIEGYIADYKRKEGIQLERGRIEKNPGLRKIAKLQLNTLYGKFGQNTDRKKTLYIKDTSDLYNTLLDPQKEVTDFHILSENLMQLEYKDNKYFAPIDGKTNVVIAAFCTTWARLKLWFLMNKLGRRVLYHDTDSVIYSSKPADTYEPELGEYLGDLTDELTCSEVGCKGSCRGHWIEEFVSCGPKNYAYRLNSGQYCVKVRGFSLNHRASQILNFETMKSSLMEWHRKLFAREEEEDNVPTISISSTMIARDKYAAKIYNRRMTKRYGVRYNKRLVRRDFSTLPFGFRR